MPPRQVAGTGLAAEALIGPSATPYAEPLELEVERQNPAGINAPTIEATPGNHEQSRFLQALGEEVSNNRNKGSAVKGKREL